MELEKIITNDELAEAYECTDGSWRVSAWPFSDKDRNLTKDEALELLPIRHSESVKLHDNYISQP